MTAAADPLLTLLKRTFGYDTFRPLQRDIIEAFLAGRDVLAVLPTGAGKSLTFQLPALASPGLTLVVSPLVALMKDQVDQLQAAGVAATFLNSTLDSPEARERYRDLFNGRYRLLYVSPERLAVESFTTSLQQWGVARIAVDEAHCISEWGADFRPEYRQIGDLRDKFPGVPLLALTATATPRVREDIARHLKLREPSHFLASFNRPNLSYRIEQKDEPLKQLLAFLKERPRDSGIVYCFSRKQTESVADGLLRRGIPAAPYHAGLDSSERSSTQEKFLRDEVRVVCATIAFGMGINKPNVRFVVHHDLPKNLEGYYQETGRSGRDGLPAECLLLYSGGDAAKQRHFIEEMTDPAEQNRARRMLTQMLGYAETTGCRRVALLGYFGETFNKEDCGACDNCTAPLESYDATVPAQKLLSCVYRIQRASGCNFGLQHAIDVLLGADNEKVRKRGHEQLSTYGIGKDLGRAEWIHIGRQLLSRGLLVEEPGEYPTIALTDAGFELLRTRTTLQLHRPRITPKASRQDRAIRERRGDLPHDEILFERLRNLRKMLADERNVPAYVVFGDVTLRDMARAYPVTPGALGRIGGVGERKLEAFGSSFIAAIRSHLAEHPRLDFGLPEEDEEAELDLD